MTTDEAIERFLAYAATPEGRREAAAFDAAVRASDMRYAGETLDTAFFPFLLDGAALAGVAREVEATMRLLERATAAFLSDPEMQAEYGWTDDRLALVKHDPGYSLAIPCARIDSYRDPSTEPGAVAGSLRFLEVNTDGTSGMTNVERVTEMFLEEPGMAPLRGALEGFPLRRAVLDALLACYAEFRPGRERRAREPRVAIVDWRGVKTSAEFDAFRRYFEEQGLRATITDPRDLRFDGQDLLDAHGPIDLVYRRLVSTELFARRAECEALVAAYLAGAVCVVGSFRSDVAFDKRLFALLGDPRFQHHFDDAQRALIAAHFPRTWVVRPGATEGKEPLELWACAHRAELVLKPAALYAGRGVKIGIETDAASWRVAWGKAVSEPGTYVLQERIAAPAADQRGPWADGAAAGRFHFLSLGEYAFGGRFAGFNARVASTLVLDQEGDEMMLPVVRMRGA